MALEVIILAAGQGTRMKSQLPKVLHPLAGKAMVGHVIDKAAQLSPAKIHVVVGHGAELLQDYLAGFDGLNIVKQEQQLGTGHAVNQAMPDVDMDSTVLVLYADVPLIEPTTLSKLINEAQAKKLGLLTVSLADPTGYGRIVRNSSGAVTAIVEHKDANAEQLAISEINTGILALPASWLKEWLPSLSSENAQGEYYLTDIIEMAANQQLPIAAIQPSCEQEVQGVNNRMQLAELERWYQRSQANYWMLQGVTFADPNRVDFRGDIGLGQDVSVDVNVIFEGQVKVGNQVSIGANCILKDCVIGDGVIIKPHSMIDQSQVAEDCEIGPYARLRPGTELSAEVKIGNFVETKKAIIGEGSKVNHLSYVGDSLVGCGVNIGAGTITCNYDGVNKFKTEIGDGAFIGSNTSLVAPVKVGEGATTAAGSTITKEVPEQTLAISRARQINMNSWKRPTKKS